MDAGLSSTTARHYLAASSIVIALTTAAFSAAAAEEHHLTVSSTTFVNGGELPLSMISTIPNPNGQNSCTANGAAGGNQSPQLTWKFAPAETRSFAVIVYDSTAQFTHWQMYNIPADITSLPQNAGIPGSMYGVQNGNDFFQANYNGPCPGTTFRPFRHRYQFTVYALDEFLTVVPEFGQYAPTGPEGLYQELITAGFEGHVLAIASIAGYFSTAASD